jgi:hypothetical protein
LAEADGRIAAKRATLADRIVWVAGQDKSRLQANLPGEAMV